METSPLQLGGLQAHACLQGIRPRSTCSRACPPLLCTAKSLSALSPTSYCPRRAWAGSARWHACTAPAALQPWQQRRLPSSTSALGQCHMRWVMRTAAPQNPPTQHWPAACWALATARVPNPLRRRRRCSAARHPCRPAPPAPKNTPPCGPAQPLPAAGGRLLKRRWARCARRRRPVVEAPAPAGGRRPTMPGRSCSWRGMLRGGASCGR